MNQWGAFYWALGALAVLYLFASDITKEFADGFLKNPFLAGLPVVAVILLFGAVAQSSWSPLNSIFAFIVYGVPLSWLLGWGVIGVVGLWRAKKEGEAERLQQTRSDLQKAALQDAQVDTRSPTAAKESATEQPLPKYDSKNAPDTNPTNESPPKPTRFTERTDRAVHGRVEVKTAPPEEVPRGKPLSQIERAKDTPLPPISEITPLPIRRGGGANHLAIESVIFASVENMLDISFSPDDFRELTHAIFRCPPDDIVDGLFLELPFFDIAAKANDVESMEIRICNSGVYNKNNNGWVHRKLPPSAVDYWQRRLVAALTECDSGNS